ncbi:MAG: rhodanese-related sulfurtransferase [Chlamydiia bacterium]|nr:rhodanese-related sulfurtransferase [Chlamydiia bacterium]
MYSVLAYYYIGAIEDPQTEVLRHKEFFQTRDFKGRIYISEQGINGQASAVAAHAEEYIAWFEERFGKALFKIHVSHEHAFEKMTVKYRRQLVAIDCEVDFAQKGESISPQKWKEILEERSADSLLLDVRNDYEWKVGHFEGAELPQLETFRQFPAYAKQLKETHDPKTTPVFMYCTGGIRCEFYSAVLKNEGFEKVYQLEGGVIGYGLEEGSEHWQGKLFVFDDRLVVPIADDRPAEAIATCCYCHTSHDVYYNCANMDCNALFICCISCLHAHQGCCCDTCKQGRVRPYQENAKPFRKKGTIA